MTTRKACMEVIASVGGEWVDNGGRARVDGSAWTPAGKVWASNASHCLAAYNFTHAVDAWRDLYARLAMGVSVCHIEACDTCEPADLTPAQRDALRLVDERGASGLVVGRTSTGYNVVNASAASALVSKGLLERFAGPDGPMVRRPR